MWVAYAQSPRSKLTFVDAPNKRLRKNGGSRDEANRPRTSASVDNNMNFFASSWSPSDLSSLAAADAIVGLPSRSSNKMRLFPPSTVNRPDSQPEQSAASRIRQTPSPAASLLSIDRRPSWEAHLETLQLSRTSSSRSAASSKPSRERPVSSQHFGRHHFGRGGKLWRDSALPPSSGSSLYSTESSLEHVVERSFANGDLASESFERFLPGLFSRRKAGKNMSEYEGVGAIVPHTPISGPSNAQHVIHTADGHESSKLFHRDVSDGQNRAFPEPLTLGLKGQESAADKEKLGQSQAAPEEMPMRTHPSQRYEDCMLSPYETEHPGRSSRSSDEDVVTDEAPPIPPPRTSSRLSKRNSSRLYETHLVIMEEASSHSVVPEIPRRSGRRPSSTIAYRSGMPNPSDYRYSRMIAEPTSADTEWPLASPTETDAAAEAPEAEERIKEPVDRSSRASVRSNNSSLRGSHSVPLLRRMTEAQMATEIYSSNQRCTSEEAPKVEHLDDNTSRPRTRDDYSQENWEAVIDYCYDHEAEADCDYNWSRSSLEYQRPAPVDIFQKTIGSNPRLAALAAQRRQFGRLLFLKDTSSGESSPCSVIANASETSPRTLLKSPSSGNFSLPIRDGRVQGKRMSRLRSPSQLSNGHYTKGLEIPVTAPLRNHEQAAAEARGDLYNDWGYPAVPDEPMNFKGAPKMFGTTRKSGSTNGSTGIDSTTSGFEGHDSYTSTSTDMTSSSSYTPDTPVSVTDVQGTQRTPPPLVVSSTDRASTVENADTATDSLPPAAPVKSVASVFNRLEKLVTATPATKPSSEVKTIKPDTKPDTKPTKEELKALKAEKAQAAAAAKRQAKELKAAISREKAKLAYANLLAARNANPHTGIDFDLGRA